MRPSETDAISETEIQTDVGEPSAAVPCEIDDPEQPGGAAAVRSRRQSLPSSPAAAAAAGRQLMPLEVKQEALRRILAGESQASVARHLDTPVSTIATWWRKRETILSPAELLTEQQQGGEFPDQTVQELESAFIIEEACSKAVVARDAAPELHSDDGIQSPSAEKAAAVPEGCPLATKPGAAAEPPGPPVLVKPIDLPGAKRELLKSMKSAFSSSAPAAGTTEPHTGGGISAPPKKKSLELLANNLLQKALAQQEDGLGGKTETSGGPASGGKNELHGGPAPGDKTEPLGGPASLGLCLIADSYVSSGEEGEES